MLTTKGDPEGGVSDRGDLLDDGEGTGDVRVFTTGVLGDEGRHC